MFQYLKIIGLESLTKEVGECFEIYETHKAQKTCVQKRDINSQNLCDKAQVVRPPSHGLGEVLLQSEAKALFEHPHLSGLVPSQTPGS